MDVSSYQVLIAEYGAGIGGVIAILSGAWWFVKKLHTFSKRFDDFIEDWHGEPARPGVPEKPGIMERLSNQDEALGEICNRLTVVEKEVSYNSGSTIKDTVHRIDGSVNHIKGVVGNLDDRVTALERARKERVRRDERNA